MLFNNLHEITFSNTTAMYEDMANTGQILKNISRIVGKIAVAGTSLNATDMLKYNLSSTNITTYDQNATVANITGQFG